MDAKTMMLEYAANHNNGKTYTNEQWLGKAVTEGIRLDWQTTAKISRKGQTITITETRTVNTVTGTDKTDTVVMTINL